MHGLRCKQRQVTVVNCLMNIRYSLSCSINILTVHARHITLYGIEKSGVGKFTRSASVYNCKRMTESSLIVFTIFNDEFFVSVENSVLSKTFGSFSVLKKFWTQSPNRRKIINDQFSLKMYKGSLAHATHYYVWEFFT